MVARYTSLGNAPFIYTNTQQCGSFNIERELQNSEEKPMRLLAILIFLSFSAVACVSSSTYDEDTKKLKDQIEAEKSKISDLRSKLKQKDQELGVNYIWTYMMSYQIM